MFKAKFWKYWDDNCNSYEDITAQSIEGICEYAYQIYRDSVSPYKKFYCGRHCSDPPDWGTLELSCALPERFGKGYGVLLLMRVTYDNGEGDVIVFDKTNRYISPKTLKVFNEFGEAAKQREANKFGEW